jgi:hypothetical protein
MTLKIMIWTVTPCSAKEARRYLLRLQGLRFYQTRNQKEAACRFHIRFLCGLLFDLEGFHRSSSSVVMVDVTIKTSLTIYIIIKFHLVRFRVELLYNLIRLVVQSVERVSPQGFDGPHSSQIGRMVTGPHNTIARTSSNYFYII